MDQNQWDICAQLGCVVWTDDETKACLRGTWIHWECISTLWWSDAKSVPISRAIWLRVKKLTELIQIHLSFSSHTFTFFADDCAPPQRFDWINLWAITWSGNVLPLMTTGTHWVECVLLLRVPEQAGSQRRHADFNSLTFQSTWLCGVCGRLPKSRESKGRGRKGRAVV